MFEESAGIILIHAKLKEILLVQQKAGHWSFPKGHLEEGETTLQAAFRELKEETGIIDVKLFGEPIVKEYNFKKNNIDIHKKVTYFPGVTTVRDVILKHDEIQNFAWLSFEDAKERLTYAKEVIYELNNNY